MISINLIALPYITDIRRARVNRWTGTHSVEFSLRLSSENSVSLFMPGLLIVTLPAAQAGHPVLPELRLFKPTAGAAAVNAVGHWVFTPICKGGKELCPLQ